MPRKKTSPQPSSPPRKRILIVDDHPIMRQGLTQLINNEDDMVVCCEASGAGEALALIGRAAPDLAIVDLSLEGRHGLELIKDLRALHPQLSVLVLSMHDEKLYAERVLRAGARGYIMKQAGGKLLIDALRQVLAGKISVSPQISARILESFAGHPAEAEQSPLQRLTDREFEVFELLGHGRSSREIATQLNLSIKTVEVHRANVRAKLKLKTGPELVMAAVRWADAEGRSTVPPESRPQKTQRRPTRS